MTKRAALSGADRLPALDRDAPPSDRIAADGGRGSEPAPSTSSPPELDGFERALADLVRLLTERGTRSDIARRSGHDLPPASWALLEYLDGAGPRRVSDIAACQGLDASSVTPRLQSLHSAGLITRAAAPHDARVSMISISPAGQQALESVHAARRALLVDALGGVQSGELHTASAVLARAAARLRADGS